MSSFTAELAETAENNEGFTAKDPLGVLCDLGGR
jgi:hypothetical protein